MPRLLRYILRGERRGKREGEGGEGRGRGRGRKGRGRRGKRGGEGGEGRGRGEGGEGRGRGRGKRGKRGGEGRGEEEGRRGRKGRRREEGGGVYMLSPGLPVKQRYTHTHYCTGQPPHIVCSVLGLHGHVHIRFLSYQVEVLMESIQEKC